MTQTPILTLADYKSFFVIPCRDCEGTGKIDTRHPNDPTGPKLIYCDRCAGTGEVENDEWPVEQDTEEARMASPQVRSEMAAHSIQGLLDQLDPRYVEADVLHEIMASTHAVLRAKRGGE